MTDDELAMAYADGELDAISAKRFEKRIAEAPELAAAVAAHCALRTRLQSSFAPIAEAPLPDRLIGLLQANVVVLPPRKRVADYWRAATAMAACLVGGVAIGHFWQPVSVTSGDQLMASGMLARSLDEQLAGGKDATRVLISFRDQRGQYCRVFEAPRIGGIACREKDGWALRRTQAHAASASTEYRQAGNADGELFAAAQGMMAGEPLSPAVERAAQAKGWRD